MKVKIFTGFGGDGTDDVEREVNSWLAETPSVEVKDTQTALCQVSSAPEEERYQCLVITVWYE